jgi:hypothetical protein
MRADYRAEDLPVSSSQPGAIAERQTGIGQDDIAGDLPGIPQGWITFLFLGVRC